MMSTGVTEVRNCMEPSDENLCGDVERLSDLGFELVVTDSFVEMREATYGHNFGDHPKRRKVGAGVFFIVMLDKGLGMISR